MTLEGKVAIITGGSKGIGFGIAKALASNGVYTYIIARNQEDLKKAKSEIEQTGGRADFFSADITDLETVKVIINDVYEQNGRLDFFINNAGEWKLQSIGSQVEELRKMRDLTDRAPSEITEYLVDKFRDIQNDLKILNVASQASLRYLPGNLGYGKGKKGLLVTMLELQGEMNRLGIDKVKLYGLYPATVATPGVIESIKRGELQDATTLDSVVSTAMKLLSNSTPTRHAYVGYIPGKGIIERYFTLEPETFTMLPQIGPDQIIQADFNPQDIIK